MTVVDEVLRPVADVIDVPTDLFVAGSWRPAAAGRRLEVADPATGSVLATVADADTDDATAAVDAAAAAAADWAATSPRSRADLLMRAFHLMQERSEELALLISLENGKSLPDARGEVAYAAEFFRWYAEEGVRLRGQVGHAPSGANRLMVTYQPVGVSVLVTPWNFPAAMATRKIAPALAAGCTTVLKPAAETPLTALAVAALLEEVGLPAGVLNVVTTSRPGPVVETMLTDRRTRMVSFTGSTEVGRVLLKEAADQVINCSMELGGNAPFVVFADADMDAAVEGAMIAKMRNGGEACTAANRFYVERPVAEEFGRRMADKMKALKMGPGLDEGIQLGPLVNTDAVEKVDELVRGAVESGAEAVVGGRRPEDDRYSAGFYYEPTVLLDVRPGSKILEEEIFGPVAPIVAFDDEDEAVRLANATEYGLVSYVYTGDLGRGLRVSEKLEAGMVGLNRGLVSDPAAPFGGTKQSGIGREGGHDGMLEFQESKYIAVQW
jgi:succinate-semialdehyde dehydrogenase / glutarate-semialdehyde dehydrogenase